MGIFSPDENGWIRPEDIHKEIPRCIKMGTMSYDKILLGIKQSLCRKYRCEDCPVYVFGNGWNDPHCKLDDISYDLQDKSEY